MGKLHLSVETPGCVPVMSSVMVLTFPSGENSCCLKRGVGRKEEGEMNEVTDEMSTCLFKWGQWVRDVVTWNGWSTGFIGEERFQDTQKKVFLGVCMSTP